ncbi:2-hydroxychromene-2-carboxylate isomerase [Solimonas soli]|uniref:2-hydroxychromene-2-carboxylate isomerase n=1 Tax=Solimonas soli TaxID=413479 RepID=UPI00048378FE|nr:2-hydroxychromene-2-carboxylate isomerase [Solimonas soli]
MAAPIEFYFDAVSPYTYLAATQIDALAARHGAAVVWIPILLGKILEASGNRPPISVPAKARYMHQDLQQWAECYGVPLRFPTHFPVSTLSAQRIACALPDADVGRWARATLHAYWAEDADLSQPQTLRAIAAGLGCDGEALLARAQEPAVKERLKHNTDEALRRGMFGAPTFFVGETMFWGNDRLPLLERALARA